MRTINNQSLAHRLPNVRRRYSEGTILSALTWFRVGGPAEIVYRPADSEDLSFFLKSKPRDVQIFVLGVGSNILVRDGGIPGVVIRLGKYFNNITINECEIDVGASVLDRTVAFVALDAGLTGLEFLCGIPGTIGGALRMNAGAYGSEISDVIVVAFAMDPKGKTHHLTPEDLKYSYRYCGGIPDDWVFVGARLKASPGNKAEIAKKIEGFLEERDFSQPVRSRTGGSTFKNPPTGTAWGAIDQAGCRGLRQGNAKVSEKHCNFLINTGDASAADLEELGEEVRQRVKNKMNIELEWEIHRIGVGLNEELKKAI
jgi:UDP-N-acetylmuramate dehydrogenase